MVERAGEAAKLGFKAHPHMLRAGRGFALANKGHDTLLLQAYLGAQEHSTHGSLYPAGAGPLQGLLALMGRWSARNDQDAS